ncbi:MAG: methyltransferase domain-containing protein [Pseudomonadota bacterium]
MTLSCPAGEFADAELTVNDFLGGALKIAQPVQGYRAGVDPVLLAASVPARTGQTVLELGCGGGVASLCLAHRTGAAVTGVELLAPYGALARRNAASNGITMEVVCADLAEMPLHLRERQFDHVIANPPYYDRAKSVAAGDAGRETGLGEGQPLQTWVQIAAKRLRPGGLMTFIHRAERLPHIITALPHEMGSIEVLPIAARSGRTANLILIRAKKNGRADFRLHAPLILHDGAAHVEKSKDYNPLVESVLSRGAALPFGTS